MKLKEILKSFVVISCFLIACTNEKNSNKEELLANQITLIFQSTPPQWKIYREDSAYIPTRCEIQYIDDNFIPILLVPNTEHEFDTLIIKTNRKFIEFRHTFKALEKLSYMFQNGDSVLFTYKDKTPIASVLNRETKTHDVNFDLFIKETLYPEDYSSYVKYRHPFLFQKHTGNIRQDFDRVVSVANENFAPEINREKTFVDSLYKNDLISIESYQLLTTQLIYKQKLIELFRLRGGPFPPKNVIPNITRENFNIQLGYDNEMGFINGGNILDIENDSLLYFGYQNEIIQWIYHYYLARKVGSIKSTYYINGVASAGGITSDCLALYDTIQTCSMLSQQAKTTLKLHTIQLIFENYSIDEAKQAFLKFSTDVKDSALINYVKNKYTLPDNLNNDSFDLELHSINSEKTTFDNLLEKHKGKVIYIDFWSSGCPPCIEQFKHSKRLKVLYKDKGLVQIYISSEPDKRQWEKACTKFDIIDESYFVSNQYTSKQWENMNIKYVPHYMIYDKNGNQAIQAAPRPESEDLIKILNKYLLEK